MSESAAFLTDALEEIDWSSVHARVYARASNDCPKVAVGDLSLIVNMVRDELFAVAGGQDAERAVDSQMTPS